MEDWEALLLVKTEAKNLSTSAFSMSVKASSPFSFTFRESTFSFAFGAGFILLLYKSYHSNRDFEIFCFTLKPFQFCLILFKDESRKND